MQNYLKEKKFQTMFKKKIIFIILIAFATTSCGETLSSVKRGMTGEKNRSTD